MYGYLLPAAWIVVGLIVLILGGELLVRGAAGLAVRMGLAPLVVGLTVVAMGTSAPELATSTMASYSGATDVALGNIVGSNIFNVLFILGLSALVAPLTVAARLIRLDVPIMIVSSLAVLGLGWSGVIGRVEGGILLGAMVLYVAWTVLVGRQEAEPVQQEFAELARAGVIRPPRNVLVQAGLIVVGLGLLTLGSYGLVGGAVELADLLRVSDLLIGVTIVAVGTSLPQLVTSVVATVRGHRDIAVGNVVGSNIFNVLGILGIAALASPEGLSVNPAALRFDIPVMIAVSILCLPVFFSGSVIRRWEGLLFLGCFAAYLAYVIVRVMQPATISAYGPLTLMMVLPAMVILTMIGILKTLRRQRSTRPLRHRIRGI